MIELINANALHIPLADESVHAVVTSPPYYALRSYSGTATWEGGDAGCDHAEKEVSWSTPLEREQKKRAGEKLLYRDICGKCGATRHDGQLGLEKRADCLGWATGQPCGECYICQMVAVFREVKRVLRKDGTCFCNIGDAYAHSSSGGGGAVDVRKDGRKTTPGDKVRGRIGESNSMQDGLKPKDMLLIPQRLALALQADGWWVRSDIIWCISGGTYVYAKTQKGVLPMMVRDIIRLDSSTVQLWNGEKWTQLLGISKSKRRGDEIEIVLRSGERISCTPTHKFPTKRGLIEAGKLVVGDVFQTCKLPDVESPRDCAIDIDAAWLAGLYLAEGSRSNDTIQIAGHSKESARWDRVQKIAAKFGGSTTRTVNGNCMNIRIHGKILNAIIDELVTGHVAKDKGFSPSVWKYSNEFIASLVDGYLSGDGYYEIDNNRWRLGFTRNYNLERDLRTACARLGYHLILKLATVKYNGKDVLTFRGELRKERTGHYNEKDAGEVISIQKARCREVYDLGVADEPHLFALASGVLTHNSKPNPMPESVTDRPTKSHEYIWLLSKSKDYFWDQEAVREKSDLSMTPEEYAEFLNRYPGRSNNLEDLGGGKGRGFESATPPSGRNLRTVWNIATESYSGSHYATFPQELVLRCLKAATSERGCCPKCGKQWERVTESKTHFEGGSGKAGRTAEEINSTGKWAGIQYGTNLKLGPVVDTTTLGFRPACACDLPPIPATILDPFAGSGTTLLVAKRMGLNAIGLDLSYQYLRENAWERVGMNAPVMKGI